jgi:hypothetical protein
MSEEKEESGHEAKRKNASKSPPPEQDFLSAGLEYLNKRDSPSYAEIDLLKASDEEIICFMEECAAALKEKRKET